MGVRLPVAELTGGAVDSREQIDIGPERVPLTDPAEPHLRLQGPNQWPAALPELPAVVAEWDAVLADVGRRLLRQHVAASLGSPDDAVDAAFAETPRRRSRSSAIWRRQTARTASVHPGMPAFSRCCSPSR